MYHNLDCRYADIHLPPGQAGVTVPAGAGHLGPWAAAGLAGAPLNPGNQGSYLDLNIYLHTYLGDSPTRPPGLPHLGGPPVRHLGLHPHHGHLGPGGGDQAGGRGLLAPG